MGSEKEAVDVNPVVYVAVGTNVNQGILLLKWAVENFEGRKICLVHVHKPTILSALLKGKLWESKVRSHSLDLCREHEPMKIPKLMKKYFLFLSKMGIKADEVLIETENIDRGIIQVLFRHKITRLIMGAAEDTFLTKKSPEISSRKAEIVCQHAPVSCHIWFICKGVLLHLRPGVTDFCTIAAKTSSSVTIDCGETLTHDPVERVDANFEHVPLFYHSNCLVKDVVTPLDSATLVLSSEETSPLVEKVNFPEQLQCSPCDILNSKIQSKESSDLGGQLDKAIKDSELLTQLLFEESLRRWRTEEDVFDAVREAETVENRYKEESNKRQDFESQLMILHQEIQLMKDQYDQCLKEFQQIQDQIPTLETHLSEAYSAEKEWDERTIQAVNLLIKFKETRDKLQIEYDSVARKVKKLMVSSRQDPQEVLGSHFFEISFVDIIDATQNFDPFCRIGEGSNGSVFKGTFCHVKVAIKMLPSLGSLSDSEFKHEVEVLSRARHPNLVTLIGASSDSRALVYEYVENGNLEVYLSDLAKRKLLLWQTRIRIAIETCCTIIFLHANRTCKVHGNLKCSKILLDQNFRCKINDFGIHNLISQNENKIIRPTLGGRAEPKISAYMDPEILESGVLTPESDVYSFGIILLRLLTARPPMNLVADVKVAFEEGHLYTVLDMAAGDLPLELANQLADLALRCCENNSLNRPDLVSEVWPVLEPLKYSHKVMQLTSTIPHSDAWNNPKVPSYFVCPIVQEVMSNPCIAADGFTYEAEAIKGWFNGGRKTSPMTNLKLDNCDLLPNYALFHAIQEWQQQV